MKDNTDQELQAATHQLGNLLNDVITDSPHVAQALKNLKADGYDVLMRVEVSLALREINTDKTSALQVETSIERSACAY